jgi:hypothetical protein
MKKLLLLMLLIGMPVLASGPPAPLNDKQYEERLYMVHELKLKNRIGELERKVAGMQKCITELYSRVIKLEKHGT